LYNWNRWLVGLHAVQAVVVLVLATTKTFPVTVSYQTVDSLQTTTTGSIVLAPATHHLFDINLAYLVALFFGLSAVAHLLMATIYRSRYEKDLGKGINRLRWGEYALSASTMIVAIALLTGVQDLGTLVLMFVLTAVMNFLGLVMELHNPFKGRGRVNWTSYVVGCIAGVAPWIVLAMYLLATNVFGSGHIPGFVYGIYVSLLIFFGIFAVNMWLQYRKIGPWKDYLYGERMYMILSLVAKSALAWQVFAGVLKP
jgi:hypothetical protein